MSKVDTSLVMLNTFYRESILKKLWPRKRAIQHDRLKFISRPYTFNDLELAVQYDKYDLTILFYDKVIMNEKFDPYIIEYCKSLKIFKFLFNHLKQLYTEDEIKNLITSSLYTFVKKGYVDIVRFLSNKGYKMKWIHYNVNHVQMIEYFLETKKNKVFIIPATVPNSTRNININNCSSEVKKWLYENEKCDYSLEDAILDGDIEMIDYFLDECEVIPTKENMVDLINMDYERMDLIREIPYFDDDICEALIEGDNMESIESMINNGFDRDQLISYCIEKGYEDMESILYNF